jgi:hypothetical protein
MKVTDPLERTEGNDIAVLNVLQNGVRQIPSSVIDTFKYHFYDMGWHEVGALLSLFCLIVSCFLILENRYVLMFITCMLCVMVCHLINHRFK